MTLLSAIFILLHYVLCVCFLFVGVIKMADLRIYPGYSVAPSYVGIRKMNTVCSFLYYF